MLVVISPAKKLNMKLVKNFKETQPFFSKNVNELVDIARDLTTDDLQKLMDISLKLAELNRERFQSFGSQEKKAAAFTFAGDTYKGLDIETMSSEDIFWAQKHLRILSGLYGLLRPLDAIEPYRLEMGSKLQGEHGSSLYEYWNEKITTNLNQYGKEIGTKVLVNCASTEYFNVIKSNILSLRVITPVFLERKDGKEKIISFYAKNARGAMARFIIQNRVLDEANLKKFNLNGYMFYPEKSNDDQFVFIRNSL
ncbi:peroxide stress protein YaaA [Alphaproteobacteria bacterium]|nr:peroxide stress protein YaaA [Alphaproteobacteria bacterium]